MGGSAGKVRVYDLCRAPPSAAVGSIGAAAPRLITISRPMIDGSH